MLLQDADDKERTTACFKNIQIAQTVDSGKTDKGRVCMLRGFVTGNFLSYEMNCTVLILHYY